MCPGQACGGAAWGGELPLARVVRDCAPESGVVFIYMTRLARTHNKTRALQCHPPPLRGKSSTVHRPRRPRVSQHLPAVNPHPVAIHSRPFEQPFRTGSDTRYHPDPPQISRTYTQVSPADGPSAWDKTGGAGCRGRQVPPETDGYGSIPAPKPASQKFHFPTTMANQPRHL